MAHRLRLNSYLLPALTVIVLFMELVDGSKVWTLLLIGLGGAWLTAYWWAHSLQMGLHLKREMRFGWAQVGDTLEERFTLENHGMAPALWVEVIDHSNLPDYPGSSVTGVGSSSRQQWRTKGLCTRRGLYTVGPTSLETGDPLGMYTVTFEYSSSANLMVMPPVVPLPAIEVAPGGRSGEGRPRQNAPERTVSAASVREYIPGDSLHNIHWPTTARHDAPYVHIFDGTPAGDWWIFLDLEKKIQVGQGWDSTVEHAVILAASLADRGLRMRRAVGLVCNGDKLVWLPPQEGNNYRWEILRALALVNPGETSLADLMERTSSDIGRRSSVILITPNATGDWIEKIVPLLWRGTVPTVLLLDPISFGAAQETHGDVAATSALLTQMGVARFIITHDMLNQPEARPGRRGKWEWRVMPTGRAVSIYQPGDVSWKTID